MPDTMTHDAQRREFFNNCAHGWENRNYCPQKMLQIEEALALVDIAPGMTVVDIGCGQGILLPFLRRRVGQAGRIIAVDPAQQMLKYVPMRDAQTWPLLASAENLPLLDQCAHVVICFSAFPHVQDKAAAAQEMYRILKPDGQAHVLHIDGREKLDHLHDQHHAVRGDYLPCPHSMRRLFGTAGFQHMTVDDHAEHYYFSARKQEVPVHVP